MYLLKIRVRSDILFISQSVVTISADQQTELYSFTNDDAFFSFFFHSSSLSVYLHLVAGFMSFVHD